MRLGQWLGLLVFAIALYILWQIRQVVLLLFAAVVLATALNRIVRQMQQYHIKRGIAIAVTVVILLSLIVGFFAVIVPRIIDQLQQLIGVLPQVSARIDTWVNWLQSRIPGAMFEFRVLENIPQQLQTWIARLLGNFFVFLNNSLTAILSVLLFLVLTIMLLANPSQYR
ncbi:AI-2E family transporter, partial [Gloeocapsopsis crepidinum]